MTRRIAIGASLLLTLAASAAPVPKESGEAMVKRVYGTATDPDSKAKCEPVDKDGLKLTLAKNDSKPWLLAFTHRPVVDREIEGDFVVTVRVAHDFDHDAKALPDSPDPSVAAGIAVCGSEPKNGIRLLSICEQWRNQVSATALAEYRRENGGFRCIDAKSKLAGSVMFLRLTRTGEDIRFESSESGERWVVIAQQTVRGLEVKLRVGPTLVNQTNADYSATFDHYTLKPLEAKK